MRFIPPLRSVLVILGLAWGFAIGATAAEDGWERALAPRLWQFPRDHGSHPEFKTEWWYVTGNLATADGRPFGYQFTIFRQGLTPKPVQVSSQWAIRDFYFGHAALSDIQGGNYFFKEAIDRGALGLAGADRDDMRVWLRHWRIERTGADAFRLYATEEKFSLDLTVTAEKPLVLQGDRGLSHKSATPGNASHYYSYTRLRTEGVVKADGTAYKVSGSSWLDREFSTSALGAEQAGWDWFSLQFDNGEEAMIYLLRGKDGSVDPTSQGTWIDRQGHVTPLRQEDIKIEVTSHWKSLKTGANYPAGWRISIPSHQAEFTVTPRMADQEFRLEALANMAYWEGACALEGTINGHAVKGNAYTELTGYGSPIGTGMKD